MRVHDIYVSIYGYHLKTLMLSVMFVLLAIQAKGQSSVPSSCGCQGGTDVAQSIPLCINGTQYQAIVTRCQNNRTRNPLLQDPCQSIYQPDVITVFKSICLDSTVNFAIDDVVKAVLCYYDPCKQNGLGATVPLCTATPNVFCWAYSFPKCWQRTSNGCFTACTAADSLCCWQHRRYCIDSTGNCVLTQQFPQRWSCSFEGNCPAGCIVPQVQCPEPSCSQCP